MKQDDKKIQIWKNLRRLSKSKVQLSIGPALRSDHLAYGLDQWVWGNAPRTDYNLSGQLVPLPDCLEEKFFLDIVSSTFVSTYIHWLSSSCLAPLGVWLCLLDGLPAGARHCLYLGPPKSSLDKVKQAQFPQSFLTGQVHQPLASLQVFHWTCSVY